MITLTEPEQYIADLFEIPHQVFYELNMKVNTIEGVLTYMSQSEKMEILRKSLWESENNLGDFNKMMQKNNLNEFLAGWILIEVAFYEYDSDDFNNFLKYYQTKNLDQSVV